MNNIGNIGNNPLSNPNIYTNPNLQQQKRITSSAITQNQYINSANSLNKSTISINFLTKNFLIIALLVVQAISLFFVFRLYGMLSEPVTRDLRIVNVLNSLSRIANIPPAVLPNQVNVIGDGTLPNIDDLRKIGPIQEEVFKNAQNGDYVFVYAGINGNPDRLIIFRESTNTVIYDGKTIAALDQENRIALLNRVIEAAKSANLVPKDSEEIPSAQVVADSVKFKQENDLPFFSDVQNGDIIAIFRPRNGEALTVIYRPATNTIIKTGVQTIRSK